nr:alpha-amylase family glycosyl hydrolase [Microbacterium aurum]
MTLSTPARRRLAALTTALLVGSGAVAVVAAPSVAADRTPVLVGSLQSEIGCPGDWDPACAASTLQPVDGTSQYAQTFDVPAGTYEYKVALDGTWDESYGADGAAGGANLPLTIDGPARLRFVYDDESHRIGIEVESLASGYTAADDALVAAPVRQAGDGKQFYFVMTDRFANGDAGNDTGGLTGDRLTTGFDPTSTGFYNGGDLAGLQQNLDYIAGLGTTAIWLTPSFKNKPVQGVGADASAGYHGYWVTDFTQIDPHLGTNDELKALIDDAHDRGIDVYFDIITNHTADVISYAENQYTYIDQASAPYTDAAGTPFDPADYAGTNTFPAMDAATSFPYTPVVADAEKDIKVPAWLNDVTLYHNRGDSTYSGESTTYGDFSGLDDLMTENPAVVDGFAQVYQTWIDLGIDGFRIDTAKHVNFEFWQGWTTQVLDYAHSKGKSDFFMFGEVYDADPALLAPYVRDTDMSSVLDFTFQSAATSFAKGGDATVLQKLFAGDDRYTTPDSSATALPTFLGNHDMGRIGYLLKKSADAQARDQLAHDLMFLSRGQPVVYYGDEQGFTGADPGNDKSARQSLFASDVAEYQNQTLIDGSTAGSVDRYDTDAVLYRHIAALADLRAEHPALVDGAQIERYAKDGVYAFSRVDAAEKVEYLVALNNTASAATVSVPTLTAAATFTGLYGASGTTTSDADAAASVTVPALSAVVYRADRAVTAPSEAAALQVTVPVAGAGVSGSVGDRRPVVAADELRLAGCRRRRMARAGHRRRHHPGRLPRRRRPGRRDADRVPRGVDGCRRPPLRGIHVRLRRQPGHPRRGARAGGARRSDAVRLRQHPRVAQHRDGLRGRLGPRLRPGADDAGRRDLAAHRRPAGRRLRVQGRDREELGRELRRERCGERGEHRALARGRTGDVLVRSAHEARAFHRRRTRRDPRRVVPVAGRLQHGLGAGMPRDAHVRRRRRRHSGVLHDEDRDGRLPGEGHARSDLERELRRGRREGRREHRLLGDGGQTRHVPLRHRDARARDHVGRPAAGGHGTVARALDRRRDDRLAGRAGCEGGCRDVGAVRVRGGRPRGDGRCCHGR